MEPRTVEHLTIGEKNRDLARALLTPSQAALGLAFAPWEWVAVIAFYAAVHDVNAYLWESAHIEPATHGERLAYVRRDRALRRCQSGYARLQNFGFHARYTPGYVVSEHDARELVTVDLRAVEVAVMAALKLPAPAW